MLKIFEPFEVRDSHTTNVCKDVRDDHDALSIEDLVSLECRWTVSSLDDN